MFITLISELFTTRVDNFVVCDLSFVSWLLLCGFSDVFWALIYLAFVFYSCCLESIASWTSRLWVASSWSLLRLVARFKLVYLGLFVYWPRSCSRSAPRGVPKIIAFPSIGRCLRITGLRSAILAERTAVASCPDRDVRYVKIMGGQVSQRDRSRDRWSWAYLWCAAWLLWSCPVLVRRV